MPELPEVETIRRDLLPLVSGRTITEATISPNAPRLVQLIPPEEFCRQIAGRRIEDISRRGKYLLLHLTGGLYWIVHLRMTGRLFHRESGCPEGPHLRATFRLDTGASLCFVDLRKFGTMWLIDDPEIVVSKLGPEPLSDDFTVDYLRSILKRRSAPVKSVLLDQAAIAGVGNIYADEACYNAGVNPRKSANKLSKQKAEALHAGVRQALLDALGDRGSSFDDYVDGRGSKGAHQLNVRVFRRTGEPCFICGRPIRRGKVGGRSTHYCPRCQR
jgi:formamidopyrimidine-DNA glycosylase